MRKEKFKPTLLLVDDSPIQLKILEDSLKETYHIFVARNASEALSKIKEVNFDLIISDIIMPNMDGIALYNKLKQDSVTDKIAVIFITSVTDVESKINLLEAGAFDYITKPFNINEVRARIKNHLRYIGERNSLKENIVQLQQRIKKQNHEVDSIYDLFYGTIVNIALTKSKETGLHLVRTKYYLAELLKKYLQIYQVPAELKESNKKDLIEHMMQAATMHDIGKVGIPDHILMKPSKLTEEEFDIMKNHTIIGYNLLSSKKLTLDNTVLKYAKEITHYHHERWDGSGYPEGLSKEEIPFSARIMAIADVYDALVSKRIYKAPISHEEAVKIIFRDNRKSFDPILIDIFLNEHQKFRKIAKEYADKECDTL